MIGHSLQQLIKLLNVAMITETIIANIDYVTTKFRFILCKPSPGYQVSVSTKHHMPLIKELPEKHT